MFRTVVLKELTAIMSSPRFPVTFAVVSVLVLLSIAVGIAEYRAASAQHRAAGELIRQEMREARGWMGLRNRVYREPDPMQIFASGVHNDVGRLSAVSQWEPVRLTSSPYSDDPVYALFRFLDFTFVVQVVLTLFAILFTYDAVNGEREAGTLQLALSNPVPRATLIAGKFAGAWLGLAVPVSIPVLAGTALLPLLGVPMTAEHWMRLGMLVGASMLLFTLFIGLGILVSSSTRRSAVSFLVCLVTWVAAALIVPRAGMMAAGGLVPVPTDAELNSRQDVFEKDMWNAHLRELQQIWRARNAPLEGLSPEDRRAEREAMEWVWAEEDGRKRDSVQAVIGSNATRLREEARNLKAARERLAFNLSRISPVSAYQLAAMSLAGTDVALKTRYEDALESYRTEFNAFRDRKQRESGATGGIRVEVDSDRGVRIDAGRDMALDLSGMPEFTPARPAFADAASSAMVDSGIIALFALAAFGGAFAMFLRYDPRASA